jgi:hypothetical protein
MPKPRTLVPPVPDRCPFCGEPGQLVRRDPVTLTVREPGLIYTCAGCRHCVNDGYDCDAVTERRKRNHWTYKPSTAEPIPWTRPEDPLLPFDIPEEFRDVCWCCRNAYQSTATRMVGSREVSLCQKCSLEIEDTYTTEWFKQAGIFKRPSARRTNAPLPIARSAIGYQGTPEDFAMSDEPRIKLTLKDVEPGQVTPWIERWLYRSGPLGNWPPTWSLIKASDPPTDIKAPRTFRVASQKRQLYCFVLPVRDAVELELEWAGEEPEFLSELVRAIHESFGIPDPNTEVSQSHQPKDGDAPTRSEQGKANAPKGGRNAERNADIFRVFQEGATRRQLAKQFSLSYESIKAIVSDERKKPDG